MTNTDHIDGFIAASEGGRRDERQSLDWLDGFDGYFRGVAENATAKAELDRVAAALPSRRRKRQYYSLTPRTIG